MRHCYSQSTRPSRAVHPHVASVQCSCIHPSSPFPKAAGVWSVFRLCVIVFRLGQIHAAAAKLDKEARERNGRIQARGLRDKCAVDAGSFATKRKVKKSTGVCLAAISLVPWQERKIARGRSLLRRRWHKSAQRCLCRLELFRGRVRRDLVAVQANIVSRVVLLLQLQRFPAIRSVLRFPCVSIIVKSFSTLWTLTASICVTIAEFVRH